MSRLRSFLILLFVLSTAAALAAVIITTRRTLNANCGEAIGDTDLVIDCDAIRTVSAPSCEKTPPCEDRYVVHDVTGCCVPDGQTTWVEGIQSALPDMIRGVIVDKLIRMSVQQSVKLSGRVLARAGFAQGLARLGTRMGSRVATRMGALAAASTVKSVMSKVNPIMTALDIMTIIYTVWDPSAFGNFTSNRVLMTSIRDKYEYEFEKVYRHSMQESGVPADEIAYPPLFPLEEIPQLTEPWGNAMVQMELRLTMDVLDKLIQNNGEDVINALVSGEDGETVNVLDTMIDREWKTEYQKRDDILYEEFVKLLSDDNKLLVERRQRLSLPNRIGISLSRSGCVAWNASNKSKWESDASGYPSFAVYSDQYGEFNKAMTVDENTKTPAMLQYRLPQKAALWSPLGDLYVLCSQKHATRAETKPKGFDEITRTCRFGRAYCEDGFTMDYVVRMITYSDHAETYGSNLPMTSATGDTRIDQDVYDDCYTDVAQTALEIAFGPVVRVVRDPARGLRDVGNSILGESDGIKNSARIEAAFKDNCNIM